MDRNTVILDGQHKPLPGGSNGIEVYKANNVWIENLTVRNFDRAEPGRPGRQRDLVERRRQTPEKSARTAGAGSYLTAYDTGLNGGYGIFTNNETEGEWENIYASGFNDSGIYLGACQECKARINNATMENNALGYSGSNSGGSLVIENSIFRHNSAGHRAELRKTPATGRRRRTARATRHKPANTTDCRIHDRRKSRGARSSGKPVTENNNLNAPATRRPKPPRGASASSSRATTPT